MFLPEDAQLPKKNPPYPSSIFPDKAKHIISLLSYFLGCYSYEWVDEAILGFLSIFSTEEKPSMIFNFSQFLADNIHEKLLKFQIEVMFKYASLLVYMFLFYQEDNFPFSLQKLNEQGNPHSVIFWTSLVRTNIEEHKFKDYIDQFIHPATCLLRFDAKPRFSNEIQKILHLSEKGKTCD